MIIAKEQGEEDMIHIHTLQSYSYLYSLLTLSKINKISIGAIDHSTYEYHSHCHSSTAITTTATATATATQTQTQSVRSVCVSFDHLAVKKLTVKNRKSKATANTKKAKKAKAAAIIL
jgi:hypothetical protein